MGLNSSHAFSLEITCKRNSKKYDTIILCDHLTIPTYFNCECCNEELHFSVVDYVYGDDIEYIHHKIYINEQEINNVR